MHLFVFIFAASIVISDAFFLFAKHERWLFCFKICPLYCSPRRYDEDAAATVYADDDLSYHYPPYQDHYTYPHIPSYPRYVICKPETTTTQKPTTMKPTTTTPEPSYLCMMCMRKCNDLDRK